MSQFLLLLIIALVVGGIIFGVFALLTGSDPGMVDVDPHVRSVPLPDGRGLEESDLLQLRFDIGLRGYRSDQVDAAIDRIGTDLTHKEELIGLLESEVAALRDGRIVEANQLKQNREQARETEFTKPREQAPKDKVEPAEMSDHSPNVEE